MCTSRKDFQAADQNGFTGPELSQVAGGGRGGVLDLYVCRRVNGAQRIERGWVCMGMRTPFMLITDAGNGIFCDAIPRFRQRAASTRGLPYAPAPALLRAARLRMLVRGRG
jgi:hypothetical protein